MHQSTTLRYSPSVGLKLGSAPKGYSKWVPLAFSQIRVNNDIPTKATKKESSKRQINGWMKWCTVLSWFQGFDPSELHSVDALGKGATESSTGSGTKGATVSATRAEIIGDNGDTGYLAPVFLSKLFEAFDGVRTIETIVDPMAEHSESYVLIRAMSKDKLVEMRAVLPTNENYIVRDAIDYGEDIRALSSGKIIDDGFGETTDYSVEPLSASGIGAIDLMRSCIMFRIYDGPHSLRPRDRDDGERKSRLHIESEEQLVSMIYVGPMVLTSPSFIKNYSFRVPPPPPSCAADDKEMWIMPNDWRIMTRIIDAEVSLLYAMENYDYSYMQWIPYLTTVGVQSDTVRAFLQRSIDTFTSIDTSDEESIYNAAFPTSNPIMYPY